MCQLRGKSAVIVMKYINLLPTTIIINTWPTTGSKHVHVLKMFQNSLLAALLLYMYMDGSFMPSRVFLIKEYVLFVGIHQRSTKNKITCSGGGLVPFKEAFTGLLICHVMRSFVTQEC
jgi:hypothetical protein